LAHKIIDRDKNGLSRQIVIHFIILSEVLRVSAGASGTVTTYEVVTTVSGSETINARAAGYKAESASVRISL